MKTLKLLLLLFLLTINGCTKEDDINKYSFTIINESSENLTLSFLNQNVVILTTEILNNSSYSCNYTAEVNTLISECSQEGIDGIEIIFSNGKGYLCYSSTLNDNSFCFSDSKSFFNQDSYIDLGNHQYEFVITEEDFTNAYDLPL